ncbi:MAG: hypothetical protein ACRDD7_02925 [Peptostreptococcaceae bacterium]
MIKVGKALGEQLMDEWGNHGWEGGNVDYYVWEWCCVFAVAPLEDGHQIHMAMQKGARYMCRDAAMDVIKFVGGTIYAPLLKANRSIANMVKKLGFEHLCDEPNDISVYVLRGQ